MDQLTKLITGLTTKQKLSILVTLLLVAGGIYGLTRWKHETDFRSLYSSMAPEDAAAVVQKLKETGVEYRLSENGSGVMIPSGKIADARLALASAGLPKTGRIGFELFDKTNFGATELVEHINYQRALEGELERTIMAISEVEMARVHLTLTKESVFLDQQQPAKASVMVKLRAGMRMQPQNVMAVSNLVASAVQDLSPSAVSILDTDGRLLSRPIREPNDPTQYTTETLELRQHLEHDLVTKINTTLEPLLGADRFRAQVVVDCDPTSAELQEESYDPTKSVMVTSQKTEDTNDRGTSSSGVPGTASNLPRPTSQTGYTGGETTRRTENINYETSRTIRKTRIPQGLVKRLSVSVLVGQDVRWELAGKTKRAVFVPPTPETLKSIKDIVAGATGIDPNRGDQLIVDTLPFEALSRQAPPVALPNGPESGSPPPDTGWRGLVMKNLTSIILAVVGLAVVLILTRSLRKKPVEKSKTVEMPLTKPLAPGSVPELSLPNSAYAAEIEESQEKVTEHIIERVRQMTETDIPKATAVVRTWLQETGT